MLFNAWCVFLAKLKARIGNSGPGTKSRRLLRPLFLEPLESRIVPSTDSWANPLGGSWSDPANWSTGALPTAGDDVVINLSSSATVHLSDVSAAVNSLQVNNALVLDGGALTVANGAYVSGSLSVIAGAFDAAGGLTVDHGSLTFTGGALGGPVLIADAALTIGPGATAAADFTATGLSTLTGVLAAAQTLTVQGGAGRSAVLTLAGDFTNAGTIRQVSTDPNADADLTVSGTFTNAATGVIDVQSGAGGGRHIDGSWVNDGTVNVEAGAGLFLQPSGGSGPNVTLAGGTLNAGAGYVAQIGGVFHYTGGALGDECITFDTELDITDTTGTGLIEVRGADNPFDEDLSPGVTLWVQGCDWNGDASLTAAAGAVNAGTILLKSLHHDWWTSDLYVGPSFTNAATGVIDAAAGAGGDRHIDGSWVNDGTIIAEAGVGLFLQSAGGGGPDVTLAGGTLNAGAGYVAQIGGVFHYTGGALGGECITFDTELDITDTTGTGLIEVRGANNPFDEDLSPGVTLWVQGCDWNGNATLIAADGAVNAGTILLESLHHDFWSSDLVVAGGGTLTNTAGGALTAQAGAGGGRLFQGNLVNRGALTVDAAMQWAGAVANSGTIAIAAGVEVDPTGLNGAAFTFSQTAGSLTVDGALVLDGGAFDVAGGALDGGGTLRVQNARLTFGAGAGGPLPVQVVGQGDVLLDNLGSVTVWVRGDDRFNQGVLTTGPGAVNAGTILLQSASSWWGSFLAITDGLDNTAAGVIHAAHGAGGVRSLSGDLTNEGTVLVDADATVEIDGDTLTQNDGVLQANGQVLLNGGFLDFEGGAIAGAFYAENAQIYVSPDVSEPSLVHVVGGGDLLLDNASDSTTLLVQGDDRYNAGVLTVAADATNAGVIQLDSASTYWGSSLVLQDLLDNTPTGSIRVTPGAGGGRAITGDIDNEGLLSVAAGEQVVIGGATDAGPTFIQDGGLIQADGRLVLDGGLLDFESGDVNGSLYVHNSQIYVGPGAADPATVYVVGSGNTLLGNEGPSVTLWVEGDDAYGQGVLTAAAGAVNAGSIVLGSTSTYWGSALAAPNTLLNASGGLIAVADDGGGSRSLVGDFLNAGTIFVPPDQQLALDGASGGGPTLIQDGGLIAAGGRFIQDGGLFDYESGGVLGAFTVNGARIYVGPEVVAPNTIEVVGPYNTLLDNASAVTTLWVQGDDHYNAGVLTAAPGAVNAGTIILASSSAYWGETLAVPSGLVNLAGAHIAVYGGGGPAALTGTLTNDGYLSLSGVGALSIDALVNNGTVGVDATGDALVPGLTALGDRGAGVEAAARAAGGSSSGDAGSAEEAFGGMSPPPDGPLALTRLTVGAWTNNGSVDVDAGTQLEVASDGTGRTAFTQAGGLVAADGRMIIDGAAFDFSGGGLWGDFAVRNGWIRVDPSETASSTIDVVGHDNTLLNNAGAATLRVQGGSPIGDGDAVLSTADGAVNAGTIILESLDAIHHGYLRVTQGTFTNEAGGVLRVTLPQGDAGQGSITAGWLHDDGAVADATGLPVLPPLQTALDQAQAVANGTGGSGGGNGGGGTGGGASLDPATALAALKALAPGVNSGVIQTAGVDAGPGASWADASSALFNLLNPFGWAGAANWLANAAGWLDNEGSIALGLSGADAGTGGGIWQPAATAPAGQGAGGAGPTDNPTGALIGSLYQVSHDLTDPFVAASNVGALLGGQLTQGLDLVWDVGWSLGTLGSLGLSALFGGPGPSAPPLSAFFLGAVSASGNGQLGSYLWQTATSAAWNFWNLPGKAYDGAGVAFTSFAATGDLAPLITWGGTYGAALGGLAAGGLGLVEGGAGLLQAADAGALAAEGVGAPAWVGALRGLGVPTAALDFLADECGALKIIVGDEAAAAAAGTPLGAVGPLTDPTQVAQAGLTEAATEAEATAENLASVGDTQAAAELTEVEERALEESRQPGVETESAETTITDNVEALGEQNPGENAALEAAEQPTPAAPGTSSGVGLGDESATLSTGTMTPSPGSGAAPVVTTPVGAYSWLQRAAAYFQNFSAIRELVTDGSLTVSTGADGLTVALRQALFDQMADITLATGREVALLQMKDGSIVMTMGDAGQVTFDLNRVQSIIAHTHPSGILGLSYDLQEIVPGRFVEA